MNQTNMQLDESQHYKLEALRSIKEIWLYFFNEVKNLQSHEVLSNI